MRRGTKRGDIENNETNNLRYKHVPLPSTNFCAKGSLFLLGCHDEGWSSKKALSGGCEMTTPREDSAIALGRIQFAINDILKIEELYPPEKAVRCEGQEDQEILSCFTIEDVARVGASLIHEALIMGFIENLKRFGVMLPQHFYKFERTKMELDIQPGTGQISWSITSQVVSYHEKEL